MFRLLKDKFFSACGLQVRLNYWIAGIAVMSAIQGQTQANAALVLDAFDSRVSFNAIFYPNFTGLPTDVEAKIRASGPVNILRENVPFVQAGFDTTDINMVDFKARGKVEIGNPVFAERNIRLRVGELNQSFLAPVNLPQTLGQIRDLPGQPQDGILDFPNTESFFDVIFEGWVDLNQDGFVDLGEVFRLGDAIRMYTDKLVSAPPPCDQVFESVGFVELADPNRGTFFANVFDIDTDGPLFLYEVMANGDLNLVNPIGQIGGLDRHIVCTPEPSSLVLFGLGTLGAGFARRRRLRKVNPAC